MDTVDRLDYLSALDPAHAYGLGPKASALAILGSISDHNDRMSELFRFNLMWRPSILLRHIDLFGNIPLLRFLNEEGASLSEKGVLRVTTPTLEPFSEMFRQWALGLKGQHFHHLTQIQQERYDQACRAQSIRSLRDAERLLFLGPQKIDLEVSLDTLGVLLDDSRVILSVAPKADDYSIAVWKAWKDFRATNESLYISGEPLFNIIERVIRRGAKEHWRRREFFTELEKKEIEIGQFTAGNHVLSATKVAVINQPFYDEFESMQIDSDSKLAPVSVVRDIAPSILTLRLPVVEEKEGSEQDISSALLPFRHIPIKQIAGWHRGVDPEAKTFQRSVSTLQDVLNGKPQMSGEGENQKLVRRLVKEHVEALNACIRASKCSAAYQADTTGYFIQTRFPKWHIPIEHGSSAAFEAIGVLIDDYGSRHFGAGAGAVAGAVADFGFRFLSSSVATLVFRSKSQNSSGRRAETVLKQQIEQTIDETLKQESGRSTRQAMKGKAPA